MMTHDSGPAADLFRQDLLDTMGLPHTTLEVPGVSLVEREARAETGIATCYRLGERAVLWCDAAVSQQLTPLVSRSGLTPEEFVTWGAERGHEYVGSGVMRVLPTGQTAQTVDGQPAPAAFDAESRDHREQIQAFIATCEPDDVDEADIEMDNLDPVIRCTVIGQTDQTVTAFASARPFDVAPAWWDIGVLTHGNHRRSGLGRACVEAVMGDIVAAGGRPLYRHDLENTGSDALATSLGFVPATHLCALRF